MKLPTSSDRFSVY